MRKINFYIILIIFISSQVLAYTQTKPDEQLFQKAKILLFDEEWEKAQEKLEELLEEYPRSPLATLALFYKAKCLAEQRGKEVEALKDYKRYLRLKDRNKSLAEESEKSIIDLAYKLYEKGKKSYLNEIENRISSENRVIKYYAAFMLSYIKDKNTAAKGIPVLKEIIARERDDELRDRAKIALLRVDPDAFRDMEEERYERRVTVLKIRIYTRGKKKPDFSLSIPWALADLALSAISEENKAEMRKEGYDLDKIIEDLTKGKVDIIEILGKEKIFKIWIE